LSSAAAAPARIGIDSSYDTGRLFNLSCIALLAAAWVFAFRADILGDLASTFGLTGGEVGGSVGGAFIAFGIAAFIGSPLCDILGMSRLLTIAFVLHLVGVLALVFTPSLTQFAAPMTIIWWSQFVAGLAHGLIEAVINPLAATVYPDNKTHKLNVLHAWWPGGIAIGGLLSWATLQFFQLGWQVRFAFVLLPILAYGALLIGTKFPPTERKKSNVSDQDMFREVLRPTFIILVITMLFTASLELGPGQWVNAILSKNVGFPGILVLVYVSTLMFVFRFFAGALAHKLSPIGLMWISSLGAGLGLLALSFAKGPAIGLIAATLWGMGVCYMWPTMLGIAGERFPRGGALAMGVIGGSASIIVNYGTTWIGQIYDLYTQKALPAGENLKDLVGRAATDPAAKSILEAAQSEGAPWAFRWVSVAALFPLVVFGIWWMIDKQSGGYKAVKLETDASGRPVEAVAHVDGAAVGAE